MQHHIATHVRLFGALALISALITTATPAAISYADVTTPTPTPADTQVQAIAVPATPADAQAQAISDADPITPTSTPADAQVQAETFTTYLPMILQSPSTASCVSENRAYELQVMALINAERQKNGLPALVEHPSLTLAACLHSRDMADNHFVSHTGSDGSSVADRVRAAGYPIWYVGEIAAAGVPTPQNVVDGWINSPKHHAIMLSTTATEFGVGYATSTPTTQAPYPPYWTVDFGSR